MYVTDIRDKLREARLRWFGHVTRRPPDYVAHRVDQVVVDGQRPRGRPKLSWSQAVKNDMGRCGVTVGDALARSDWRRRTAAPDPTLWDKGEEEEDYSPFSATENHHHHK
jgi:hypothetical protein